MSKTVNCDNTIPLYFGGELPREEERRSIIKLQNETYFEYMAYILNFKQASLLYGRFIPLMNNICCEGKNNSNPECNISTQSQLAFLFEYCILEKEYNRAKNFMNMSFELIFKVLLGTLKITDVSLRQMNSYLPWYFKRMPFPEFIKPWIYWQKGEEFECVINEPLLDLVMCCIVEGGIQQIMEGQTGTILLTTEKGKKCHLIHLKITAGGITEEQAEIMLIKDGAATPYTSAAFSKKIMRALYGDLTFHNVPGEYIVFTLALPRVELKIRRLLHNSA